ncbi:essential MCU regulator, mitochondrial-like [Uranotaenia lowii]|uniref:essential MCU regulator, mitochondrial-like n=1 Tax=Uranotaenia lowii TaxID=190385 RepID=UPI0024791CA8|nr:essential MCU regulator, mitochondrial-like [Uranotaenia lowii]
MVLLSNLARVAAVSRARTTFGRQLKLTKAGQMALRRKYTFRSGALKPMPNIVPFGLIGIVLTVIPGLLIGATISKNMANFLEENDLFVPSDDDDDDD